MRLIKGLGSIALLTGATMLAGCAGIGSNSYTAATGAIAGTAPGCEKVFYFPATPRNDALVKSTFGSTDAGMISEEFDYLSDYKKRQTTLAAANSATPENLNIANCTVYSRFVMANLEPGEYYVTSSRVEIERDDRRDGYTPETSVPGHTTYVVSSAMQRVVVAPGTRETVTLPLERGSTS